MENKRLTLSERLKDPVFRKEYEKQRLKYEYEREIRRALISARLKKNMTQKELSEKSGIAQPDISKIENGNGNPTINLLQRLADSMDMHLKIEFVPNPKI